MSILLNIIGGIALGLAVGFLEPDMSLAKAILTCTCLVLAITIIGDSVGRQHRKT